MQMLSKNKITPSIMGLFMTKDSVDEIGSCALENGYIVSEELANSILYMKRLEGSIQDEDLPLHFIPFDCGEMDYAAPFGED